MADCLHTENGYPLSRLLRERQQQNSFTTLAYYDQRNVNICFGRIFFS